MSFYSKESLEALRQRIDLVEVVSSYVKMQKSGAAYKSLCPFHLEKTPSFVIHKGDTHYHCFGCGAHGDAISFLMGYVKLSFIEALELLSERFQVPLEKVEEDVKGFNKGRLKAALEKACLWYLFFLLHTEEGASALVYLYQRGFTLSFIRRFEIGYAPKQGDVLYKLLKQEGFSEEELIQAGLIRISKTGSKRDFFSERISFPIRDRMGAVIGFSARKFHEETFGGKYINTAETPLFKKSQVLFGFSYSRHRIAKERKALVVEGQIDALRLIDAGFDFTVAGQGTAFGELHAKELLQLGVNHVYLALDADKAGQEASIKIGDLFQDKGVAVTVVCLPEGSDPDAFIQAQGKEAFSDLLSSGTEYLLFYYQYLCKGQDLTLPSKKTEIVGQIAERIRSWKHPVMVYESLKRLALMADLPEETLGAGLSFSLPIKRATPMQTLIHPFVNSDKVLEMDLLSWMILSVEKADRVLKLIERNISKEDFKIGSCAKFFEVYLSLTPEERRDRICLAAHLEDEESQKLLNDLLLKRINPFKEEEGVIETIKSILQRTWMDRRELINEQILRGIASEDEELSLTKQYAELGKRAPEITLLVD